MNNDESQNLSTYEKIQNRVFHMVQVGFVEDPLSRSYDIINLLSIIVNLIVICMYSFKDFNAAHHHALYIIESITVAFFALDYVLRIWTAPLEHVHDTKGKAVLKYIFSFSGIIDLISFLPFYLPFFFPYGTVAFRLFRVMRLFRIFRINAYNDSLSAIATVLKKKRHQLLSSFFIILVLMIFSSLCMYSIENRAQPGVFKNAFSGIWWAASALLTVGYGDIYPITVTGKIFGVIITFLGVGLVAIPTGIISAGFVEQYQDMADRSSSGTNNNLYFCKLQLTRDDCWAGKSIGELSLPQDLIIAVIQRGRKTIVPHKYELLQAGDTLILGTVSERDDWNPDLKELTLSRDHPWVGTAVGDLEISRQTYVVMVRRGDEAIVPDGDFVLLSGDDILLYTRRRIAGSTEIALQET